MKRFILAALPPLLYLLSCLCSVFPPVGQAAFSLAAAETQNEYACVLQDNVYFYADRSERKGMFLLPKTYFVKLLSIDAEYCQVEYGALTSATKPVIGYCKTEQLAFVDYEPSSPYFSYTFDVTYKLDGLSGAPFLTEVTKTCAYYGNYVVGSTVYCYVLQEDKFGYVPLPDGFFLTENSEYYDRLETEQPDSPKTEQPTKQTDGNPVQTAILILLCVLIPVLAALILKPSRSPAFDPDDQ